MRSIPGLILAILGLLFMGYVFFQSNDCACGTSDSKKTSPIVAPAAAAVTGPILFNHSDATPVLGKGWDALKAKFTNLGKSEVLEITGYYDDTESYNGPFENLGLARAHEAAKKFAPEVSDAKIKKIGKVRRGADKDKLFVSTRFAKRISSDRIKEVDGKALFYFPKNSNKKISDPEHEAYLTNVATKVNAEGGSVKLTGHTDSDGNAEANRRLGQRRADIIKQYLIGKGLAADKIVATSQGEDSPIASNETLEGKAQNRRTELEIIK